MPQVTLEQAMQVAVEHHHAGRLRDAEQIYRQILTQQPNHAPALHYLGVIASQMGQHEAAVDLIRRAIAIDPSPDAYGNLGNALQKKGQLDEALAAWRQGIALGLNLPEVHYNHGVALKDKGRLDEAIAAFRRVIALKPSYEAYTNLGVALREKGRLDEAIAAWRQAIVINPNSPQALTNLGAALKDKGQFDDAIATLRHAIASDPNHADAHHNLGLVLQETNRIDEAITAYRQAIALDPDHAAAHTNLGNALSEKGLFDEAIAEFRRAATLKPDLPQPLVNLGGALSLKGFLREASDCYLRAAQVEKDAAEAHFYRATAFKLDFQFERALEEFAKSIELNPNRAFTRWAHSRLLLMTGNYAAGWEEFELRLNLSGSQTRRFPQPKWDGSDATDKTVLLHVEGGFGDVFQFCRFIPRMAGRVGKLILDCHPSTVSLFKQMKEIDQIIPRGQPLPPFDLHLPLQSLPRALGITLENLPNTVPYLTAPADRIQYWASRLPQDGRPRVGLVWAGSQGVADPRTRSLKLFAPLARVSNIHFVSLQKGPDSSQPRPPGLELIDFTEDLHDFSETAALIENLDLVISVDSGVAHLAGAMGKAVWVLIPLQHTVGDFRWLINRDDSPWYPTMRLFRQSRSGDWSDAIERITREVEAL